MGGSRRILTLIVGIAAVASVASGYAHRIFFGSRSAPFNPIPVAFNLANLSNNTVPFFISDQAPGPLLPGDTSANIFSQIQAAANVWNQVSSSTIRLAFGGYSSVGATPQTAPGIDVVFNDDVPPGLLAFTSLNLPTDLSGVANGTSAIVPISRATITLRKNLTSPIPLASYQDRFFLMVAHEFGHALGLQHTLTSGVMATQVTSATSKAAPLSADDVAAISLLYPAQNYLQGTGTISGLVSVGGTGVNMANVVALSANGTAISALTNPDGKFQIQGVPPGQYYIYASPLPPQQQGESYPDNIFPAQDAQGIPFNPNTGFDTEFFPGTRVVSQAATATVFAGSIVPGVNFNLAARSGPAISYLETYASGAYSPPGDKIYSPSLYPGSWQMLFTGPGVTSGNGLAPGLSVTTIGAATVNPRSLTYDSGAGEVTVIVPRVQAAAPVALVVTLPNDMYVLPYAFFAVPGLPPFISNASGTTDPLGNTIVNLTGANLNSNTSVVFDGVPATVSSVNSDGSLTVAAPAAATGYTAYVEALAPDGQTSWQDLTALPTSYTYSVPQNPSMVVNSGLLLPGATSMLDVIGTNTSFASCPVTIGLGSSDIMVGQIWVYSAQRVLANLTVSPKAQAGPVDLTITCGLQTVVLPGVLQVQAANPRQMTLLTPILNQATGLAGTPAGGLAQISTAGLPPNLAGWTLLFDYSIPASFQVGAGNMITAQVPAGLPLGAAIVQLVSPNAATLVPPVVMQIDAPDPQIASLQNSSGLLIGSSTPVHIGDTLTLLVTGLTQSMTGAGLSSAQITIGGVTITPLTLTPGPALDSYLIQFTLGSNVPAGSLEPLLVGIGTRVSTPLNLLVLAQGQ